MAEPLSVSRLINVTVNLSPVAAARRGFGTLLVAGDSDVIDGSERLRSYTGLEAVAADFGTTAPEYYAAALYFSQSPKPLNLQIGRWLRTATTGLLRGGILTTAEQAMANFTVISNGKFDISINGTNRVVSGLNFSAQTTLNGVAGIINTAISAYATCTWDGSRFVFRSTTTGITSTVGYVVAGTGAGTDISVLTKATVTYASAPINGYAAETPVAAVTALANASNSWFGLCFAAATMPTDSEAVAVAGFIEALDIERIYGAAITSTTALDSAVTNDLGSQLKALSYDHSFTHYSSNKYAVASMFGRAFSVNFAANRSTITLMYKIEPGVVAETLTETQAQTLKSKNINVFVNYQNDTAILQYGVMSNGAFFDEIHGLAWFRDALQNALYNMLYQSATKIPQTDAGMNQLKAEAALVCDEAVNNGLVAPGQWNSDGFGQLARGDFLKSGYYIYMPPISSQAQAVRETRMAVPMQVALKLAGAVHTVDASILVNR
jgi:hypothetical protein